jgi:hypothetical protein
MSSNETGIPRDECNCWRCIDPRKRARPLIDFAKTGAPLALEKGETGHFDSKCQLPLDLVEDENITGALRRREGAFNEDVLPPDAELKAPREFYGETETRCLRLVHEQRLRKPTTFPRTDSRAKRNMRRA